MAEHAVCQHEFEYACPTVGGSTSLTVWRKCVSCQLVEAMSKYELDWTPVPSIFWPEDWWEYAKTMTEYCPKTRGEYLSFIRERGNNP